jgi:hypothetical protein
MGKCFSSGPSEQNTHKISNSSVILDESWHGRSPRLSTRAFEVIDREILELYRVSSKNNLDKISKTPTRSSNSPSLQQLYMKQYHSSHSSHSSKTSMIGQSRDSNIKKIPLSPSHHSLTNIRITPIT